jgi:hypothetical protein
MEEPRSRRAREELESLEETGFDFCQTKSNNSNDEKINLEKKLTKI